MSTALTGAAVARAPIGTNATIEQPFAAMAARRRPRSPHVLYIETTLDTGQIGAYAGNDDTPDIDRFARSGVRFTAARAGACTHGARVPELLLDLGYDGGVFGLIPDADAESDIESATRFIESRRPGPWAAYVRIAASEHERVDAAVGGLVNSVRRSGHYRRTAVLLVGSSPSSEQPVPAMLSWPGQIPPRQRHHGPVPTADWVPTLLETAVCGATRGLAVDGMDLTAHLFDGAAMPERDSTLEQVA